MSWTAPQIERTEPPYVCDERTALEAWLRFHRETLLWKCQGLSHEQLSTRAVPPSGMSLLGLVRHMTDVERWWFRTHLRGEQVEGPFGPTANPSGDFDDLDSMPAEEVWQAYQAECAAADAATAGLSLDTTFTHRRHGAIDLRWLYVHMIEEYARHNGHADLLRELVDGATGD
ncbi:DinB family protein [Longivirga aurantiaca]|uniref:DinB family protein n=1 Tax=Longivirga aurantiaca TaxID=1837743 RepID=A0ABW1T2K6_9ACTN